MDQKEPHFLVSKTLLLKLLNALNDSGLKGAVALAFELNDCKVAEEKKEE